MKKEDKAKPVKEAKPAKEEKPVVEEAKPAPEPKPAPAPKPATAKPEPKSWEDSSNYYPEGTVVVDEVEKPPLVNKP